MIDVLMPIAPFHTLNVDVVKSIDVEHRLLIETSETPEQNPSRVDRIVKTRNRLLPQAVTKFCLWLDSDAFLPAGVLAEILAYLHRFDDVGAVALPVNYPHEFNGHIRIAAMVFRLEAAAGLRIRYSHGMCECKRFVNDIEQAGYSVLQWECPPAIELGRESPYGMADNYPNARERHRFTRRFCVGNQSKTDCRQREGDKAAGGRRGKKVGCVEAEGC
jgi:hypothetical protein